MKGFWGLLALLYVAVAPLTAIACSAPDTYPDAAACPSPSPLPTPTGRDSTGEGAYRRRVADLPDRLSRLVSDFRGNWPGGTFSRQSAFRDDFRKMADESTCLALGYRSLTAPTRLAAFHEAFSDAVSDFKKTFDAGRAGVGRRNVSDYRDWDRAIDARIDAIRTSYELLPPQGGR